MKEIADDMNDERMWVHKTFGVDERAPIFPDREPQRPRRRRREQDDDNNNNQDQRQDDTGVAGQY